MSMSIRKLRSTPDEELIALHDSAAIHTSPGVNYYLDELARRAAANQTARMVDLTRAVTAMTAVITILTVVNAAVLIVG